MPRYDYECSNCSTVVEIEHSMKESKQFKCDKCGKNMEKLISPPSLKFVGDGFYKNDYDSSSKKARLL
jgi:putative FmdB family regulatory protein